MDKNSLNYDHLIKEEWIDNEIRIEKNTGLNNNFNPSDAILNTEVASDEIKENKTWRNSPKDFGDFKWGYAFKNDAVYNWTIERDGGNIQKISSTFTANNDCNHLGWFKIESDRLKKDMKRNDETESFCSNLFNSLQSNVTCEGCSGFKKLDKGHQAIMGGLARLTISGLDESFTSRDLIKILIYITKVNKYDQRIRKFAFYFARFHDEIYRCLYKHRKLSPKGIKYWELLSEEKHLEFLFNRYKPWTLHTIYKKLFAKRSLEDVYQLYVDSSDPEVTGIIKIINQRRKKKKTNSLISFPTRTEEDKNRYESDNSTENKQIIKKRRKKDKKISKLEYTVTQEDAEMSIDSHPPNSISNAINSQSNYRNLTQNQQITSTNSIWQSPLSQTSKGENSIFTIDKDKSTDQINHKSVIGHASTSQGLVNHPNKPSNLYDNNSKISADKTLTGLDYNTDESSLYITVLNSEEKNRRFYFSQNSLSDSSTSNADANYLTKYKQIKFINDIRKEYNDIYDENFIIEALMKVSNSESDLREYLNSPIHKSHITWSLIEDEILLIFLNLQNRVTEEIIKLINKMMLIKGKERVQRRINFLKEYYVENTTTFS